jgi:hypothetical protein
MDRSGLAAHDLVVHLATAKLSDLTLTFNPIRLNAYLIEASYTLGKKIEKKRGRKGEYPYQARLIDIKRPTNAAHPTPRMNAIPRVALPWHGE